MAHTVNIDIRKLLARCAVAVAVSAALFAPAAKTRWSSLQIVPNADMIAAGRLLIDADIAWGVDSLDMSSPLFAPRVHLGFSEWVNLDIGYAKGFTMGFKANIVREAQASLLPALTIGMQNIFSSREAVYFGAGDNFPKNELYIVAAKTSEWAKLRVHAGFLTPLTTKSGKDMFGPFVGFEKYFGQRLYVTVEAQRREADLLLSVFTAYRIVSDRVEFNVGVIDIPGLGRAKSPDPRVINPTARVGLKIHVGRGYNTFDGIMGVEDRLDRYRDTLTSYGGRLDSLEKELHWAAQQVHALLAVPDDRREERARVADELSKLRNLYDQEPFDPELVRSAKDRMIARQETVLPHLRVIVTDQETSSRIRALAITLIGDMGDNASSEMLISMLGRFEEPQLKTEIIITLGKLKETRARSVLAKLRDDPDGGVAFTAREIYRSLFGGGEVAPLEDGFVWPLGDDPMENTVPERRIGR